ncbi:DUF362 domain-containing protein [Clostridium tyrobutyricum]|uniref:DUF362 domain-containing protein n=1 Tax=Clostridium tyrobutyricum TaxID=1519 RepID=UPI0018A8C418|nr:DUF362 domain-containing protein [Clostridium tyrobutyricum]
MPRVYFKPVKSHSGVEVVNGASREVLTKLIEEENISLEKFIPLKVHMGEKGNRTYIKPENFNSIIDYMEEKKINSSFIETNVLYRGQRMTREAHVKTGKEHGFTRIPIVIADGENGEDFKNVIINKKHFKKCKIAKKIADVNQLIVLSHFKGHILAGFGGAVKQLAMGCAARGGKLDQHANSKPIIIPFMCRTCGVCRTHCPVDAITIKKWAEIDKDICIGCSSCQAVCPHNAITSNWFQTFSMSFNERLAEYALAAAKDKNNIYVSFALDITAGCDCEGHPMIPINGDIGIFASTDPIAIDKACLDKLRPDVKLLFWRGIRTLTYGEKIGLGSKNYDLVNL